MAALLLALAGPASAQEVQAELHCKLTDTDFVYDCRIRLQPPTPGVRLSVDADMPSMPGAHSTVPVSASPTGAVGEYRATLDLEMPGEWAVRLRLFGAVRKELTLNYLFPETHD